MAYEKSNFIDSQTLKSEHLNRIEDGIKTVENTVSNIWQTIYPVGAIYISMSETSPANLFGGTWERIVDRFLLAGSSVSYPIGDMGGEATHTLTLAELPPHNHVVYMGHGAYDVQGIWGSYTCEPLTSPSGSVTDVQGGGQAHNNMPPYLAVYMWRRTA